MPTFYHEVSLLGLGVFLFGPLLLYQILGSFGLLVYIFISSSYISYLNSNKDQKERRLANNLVANPHLLNKIVDHKVLKQLLGIPHTLEGNDQAMERCDWLNKAMKIAFPYAAAYEGRKMQAKLNAKLRSNKGITEIELTKFEAGDVAPIFTSMNVFEYTGNGFVLMECDVVFNGLPSIELRVKFGGEGFSIQISELTITCQLRMIIGPLYCGPTPAKAMGISFRKTPFIHMGMKIGGFDVSDANAPVAKAVDSQLRKIVLDEFMYPNVSWSLFDKNFDLSTVSKKVHPCGILIVHAISAKDLIIADMTTSDPYLFFQLGTEECQTKVISRNLNPEWHEIHHILVYDLEMQLLEINCFDHDLLRSDDCIGRTSYRLSKLLCYKKQSLDLILEGVPHGSIQLELLYIPVDHNSTANRRILDTPLSPIHSDNDYDDDQESVIPTNVDFISRRIIECFQVTTPTSTTDASSEIDADELESLAVAEIHSPSESFAGKVRSQFSNIASFIGLKPLQRKDSINYLNPIMKLAAGIILFEQIKFIRQRDSNSNNSNKNNNNDTLNNDNKYEPFVQYKLLLPDRKVIKVTEVLHEQNKTDFITTISYHIIALYKDLTISVKIKDRANKNKVIFTGDKIHIGQVIEEGKKDFTMNGTTISKDYNCELKFSAMWFHPSLKMKDGKVV